MPVPSCRQGLLTTLMFLAAGSVLSPPLPAAEVAGSLSGELEVTPAGAVSYRIPLFTAAGANGLQPGMALAYDSRARSGIAGPGWQLSGLSAISRCGSTLASDGEQASIRYTASDRFCLDGVPLQAVNGSYGAAGTEYRSELHAQQRIRSFGSQGSGTAAGPGWFEVEHPQGRVYRYGHSADARFTATGRSDSAVHTWALDEVRDRFGARMLFSYAPAGADREHLPTGIYWTVTGTQSASAARYRLLFEWEGLPAGEVRRGYVGGSPWAQTRRLRRISYQFRAASSFDEVHSYALEYADGGGRSRLASIRQCGPADCLPPTTLLWTTGLAGWSAEQSGPSGLDPARLAFGDFNGDGTADLMAALGGTWQLLLADPVTGRYGTPRDTGIAAGSGRVIPLELNGDGLTDLMLETAAESGQWRLYLASAGGELSLAGELALPGARNLAPLDTDGDGLDDLVWFSGSAMAQQLMLARNEGAAFGAPRATSVLVGEGSGMVWSANGAGQRPDFDGDGRQDLLLRMEVQFNGIAASYQAHLSTGGDFTGQPLFMTRDAVNTALVADVNGDGLSDLIFHDQASTRWQVMLSRGAQPPGADSGGQTMACGDTPATSERWRQARTVDYDGDGRADLLLPEDGGWRVHLSDGSCYHSTARSVSLTAGTPPAQTAMLAGADLTGNGRADLLLLREDGSLRLRRRQGTVDGLPWRIADGLGNVALLGWETLASSARYHVDETLDADVPGGGSAGGPLLHGGALQVVTAVHRTDGSGGYYGTFYRYWNARRSTQGRGFLGFGLIRVSDERDGSCRDSGYLQHFPFIGRLRTQVDYQPGAHCATADRPASAARRGDYEAQWQQHPSSGAGPRQVFRMADHARVYDVDTQGGLAGALAEETRRHWQYDPLHAAAATETVERSSPQWSGGIWRSVTSREFSAPLRSQYWCLGLPLRIEQRREQPGSAPATRTLGYQYDGNSRCLARVELEGPPDQPAQQLKTTWHRHSSGRITSIVQDSGSGLAEKRRVTIGWDSWGLRPVTLSPVIEGQPDPVLTRDWDYGLDLPAVDTDAQGKVTRYAYDDFGRLRERNGPADTALTSSWIPCDAGGCWAVGQPRYRVRELHADGYWTEVQYDSLGRVVGEASRLPDGAESRREQRWDAFGRLRQESRPYLAGAPKFWISYRHDLRGRLTQLEEPASEQSPDGRLTRLRYSRLNVTVEDPAGRSTTHFHDPEGRLLLVQAPLAGGAAYTYTPFGELESIWDAGWNETRLEYDPRGRLVRLRHPDSGLWSYEWNVFGELVRQQDDRSPTSEIHWDFDQLGRLRRRTEAEGMTAWTYHAAAGGGFGLLHTVTGPTDLAASGYRETWQYDDGSRPLEAEVVIDERRYLTSRRYDALGRLSRITYPEAVWGMRAEFAYAYADSGHLEAIAQSFPGGQLPVYRVRTRDALGRSLHVEYGAGVVQAFRDFDRAHLNPVAIRSESASDGTLQDYRYSWDLAGNLEARSDLQQGVTERFTHDALDRLVGVTRNGETTLSLGYQANGNLQYRSDAGNFSYLPDRPRAVARVSGGPRGTQQFAYDGNGNMVDRNGGQVLWTSFNLPREINLGGGNCTGDCSRFVYGPARQRITQQVKTGTELSTIHYAGRHFDAEYLPDGHVRYQMHLPADGGVVLTQRLDTQLNWESWFVLRDHLGSVDRLVRDFGSDPATLYPLSFDAFGKRRFPDWRSDADDTLRLVEPRSRRGFTDHEHLDRLGLVHMNGRVLDPALGRMLSPDPVLGQPFKPQSLNPYSYAWNSPLRLIDPDGFEAVDFNNFRPDPVHFQHASMNDAFGRAAELWTAGWATFFIGASSGYLMSQLYVGYVGISPVYRELLVTTALEIAQGAVISAQPLDSDIPDTAPLPEPIGIERPDEREPREQYPVSSSAGSAGLQELLSTARGQLSPSVEMPRQMLYVKYSYPDGAGGSITRIAPASNNTCRLCHGGGESGATAPFQQPAGNLEDERLNLPGLLRPLEDAARPAMGGGN